MKPYPIIQIAQLAAEMSEADLGDERLDKRTGSLVEMLASAPSESFPQAARDKPELQAFYRFLRMESTGVGPILKPHCQATAERIDEDRSPTVLVAHDTTDLEVSETFSPGLGPVNGERGWGFLLHASLAIQAEGPPVPYGLLTAQMWRREPDRGPVGDQQRESDKDPLPILENEHAKWPRGVNAADQQVGQTTHVVHLMDRGADCYRTMSQFDEADQAFVMRSNQNRRITDEIEGIERPKLEDAFDQAPVVAERTVSLSARDTTGRPPSAHTSRKARQATLEIRAATVSVRRPHQTSADYPPSVQVQVVWAREVDAPEGCQPVEWRLLTTEPVQTSEQALRVIDFYCRRWVIEEFFGALKGPLRPEDRQLKSGATYSTVLALMLPVAWRLLFLRTLAHHAPDRPAQTALRGSQLGVLAGDSKTDIDEPDGVTMRQALLGIAAMGGHLPRNGPPGWQVLQRGYQRLLLGEINWIHGRQQLKREIQRKWEQADSPDDFGQWLKELELEDRP